MDSRWNYTGITALILLLGACATPSTAPLQTAAPGPQASAAQAANRAGQPPATASVDAGMTKAPVGDRSLRFAVIGDTGTGERAQYDVGAMLARSRAVFPFEFVVMVGDNMYGSERPQDYARKFELPYKAILDAKVLFYASLGNHDDPNQVYYKPFNMNGHRFYSFKKDKLGNPGVRFFALDSNYMSRDQVEWLEKELSNSGSDWKIAFFHHPLYSSGEAHGSELDLRTQLEPMFLKHGLDVVLAGHDHFYERIKPQKGIVHFVVGGSAKLRAGDIAKTSLTAKGYDGDYTYMLVEIDGDTMHFQTLTRSGKEIDAGTFTRPARTNSTP